jgi:glyoxylase-like metal-dependent hydrolase (beta-lactamase superfamily II)
VAHLPGHHPDAVAITLGTAAIFVGDNLLPEITPMPSRTHFFHQVGGILGAAFPDVSQCFGLQAYLRTLKSLVRLGNTQPQFTVLPGHRLFTDGRWNEIDLAVRAVETLTHHRQRCAVILDSLGPDPQTAETTARRHFSADALEGLGICMAVNEIESHLEFLAECGDVVRVEADRWQWAGGYGFESAFDDLKAFRA